MNYILSEKPMSLDLYYSLPEKEQKLLEVRNPDYTRLPYSLKIQCRENKWRVGGFLVSKLDKEQSLVYVVEDAMSFGAIKKLKNINDIRPFYVEIDNKMTPETYPSYLKISKTTYIVQYYMEEGKTDTVVLMLGANVDQTFLERIVRSFDYRTQNN